MAVTACSGLAVHTNRNDFEARSIPIMRKPPLSNFDTKLHA